MVGMITFLAKLIKKEVVLIRFDAKIDGLFGRIVIDNKRVFHTLENSKLDIPAGHYVCRFVNSYKFGDGDNETSDVYEVMDVEDRTHILIHVGNTEVDTTGCICLGMKRGVLNTRNAVIDSRKAINLFHMMLNKKDFILSIFDLTKDSV